MACFVESPRWHGHFESHYDWCVWVNNNETPRREDNARKDRLKTCQPMLGYGLEKVKSIKDIGMTYDLLGCARYCERDKDCVAWQLEGLGAKYMCRLLGKVTGKPAGRGNVFFGYSSRYRP